MPLELLHVGDWADIADVSGEPGWVSRLAEMGVRIGCRLLVLQAVGLYLADHVVGVHEIFTPQFLSSTVA